MQNRQNTRHWIGQISRCLLLSLGMCCPLALQAQQPIYQWTFESPEPGAIGAAKAAAFQYMPGVSGKALVFDGYQTEIVQKPEILSALGGAFTITAWFAPQEYSWNISAIINQQNAESTKGFFFGINHAGHLVGSVATEAGWKTCITSTALPLLKWSYVSMVVDETKGIFLYINGEKAGETLFTSKIVLAKDVDVTLGKTQVKMCPANTERRISRAILSWIFLDGLLDELQVTAGALSPDQVRQCYSAVRPAVEQPLKFRRLPSGTDEPRPFGAYYTRLSFSPGWDLRVPGSSEFPDIVVRFDKSPVKLVFWRGMNYCPAMVTENGLWMSDQSTEQWGGGQCWEIMGDKQCRFSNVRIVENTPARIVIHWRYPLASISHQIFNESDTRPGDWCDDFWTAYPDGVVVRNQVLWTDSADLTKYQFQETIFINQPGNKPQDTVELDAISFMDMEGKTASYSWKDGAPKKFEEPKFRPVELINTKSHYRPFSIHAPERVNWPFPYGSMEGYSPFPCWNHFPCGQIQNDGRKAVAFDKPSHSSLAAANGKEEIREHFADGSIHVRGLYGMTTGPIKSLLPLARSWNNPPKVEALSDGYDFPGYDAYQRAYVFKKRPEAKPSLSFELAASDQSPVVNLPIVIKNWGLAKVGVEVDGKKLTEGEGFSQGHPSTLDSDDLILWIPLHSTSKVSIRIGDMLGR